MKKVFYGKTSFNDIYALLEIPLCHVLKKRDFPLFFVGHHHHPRRSDLKNDFFSSENKSVSREFGGAYLEINLPKKKGGM